MKTIIIPTLGAEHLIKDLNLPADFEVIVPMGNKEEKRFFPDGEIYARLPDEIMDFEGRAVIMHSGMPDPNHSLIELELLLNILNKTKASVEIFFTYFPYCMQDKAHFRGETNAAEDLMKKLAEFYKVKKIYILEAHFFGKDWIKDYPITHVSALELLKKEAEKDFGEVVFVAPDMGSQKRANIKGAKKIRHNSFDVSFHHDDEFTKSISGKVVGVVDDLVETGGTMAKFVDVCKASGAKDVVAIITHGVLDSGIARVKSAYSKLYLTNSINRPEANVDVSDLIIKALI